MQWVHSYPFFSFVLSLFLRCKNHQINFPIPALLFHTRYKQRVGSSHAHTNFALINIAYNKPHKSSHCCISWLMKNYNFLGSRWAFHWWCLYVFHRDMQSKHIFIAGIRTVNILKTYCEVPFMIFFQLHMKRWFNFHRECHRQ